MQNRREFLASISSIAFAVGCESTPKVNGGILDTHTHFYDPTRPRGVPWPPKDDQFLYRKVMPDEVRNIALPLGVRGTIVVEASSWVEDNQWILDLAKTNNFIRGLVGHLKPGRPGFVRDLEHFSADQLFRGIRVGLWDIPLTEDSAFVNDLRLLAERGLTLDVLGGPDEIEKITGLARTIPNLRIVVDHCAGVRVTADAPDSKWIDAIKHLAMKPNVHMKVSGLVEGTGRPGSAPVNMDYYRPVLDVLWDSFGEDRVLFGSNWPVSARFANYGDVLQIVREYVGTGSATEKYFRRNAELVYRVTL